MKMAGVIQEFVRMTVAVVRTRMEVKFHGVEVN
jgi:hypothetical protein